MLVFGNGALGGGGGGGSEHGDIFEVHFLLFFKVPTTILLS